jgi:hypothetical protein
LINFINSNILKEIFEKEINFAVKKIKENPNNESAYNYIRGLFDIKDDEGNKKFDYHDFSYLKYNIEETCLKEKNNFYSHGLLLDIEIDLFKFNLRNEIEALNIFKQKCLEIFEKLIVMDFIRQKYWKWRRQNFIEYYI